MRASGADVVGAPPDRLEHVVQRRRVEECRPGLVLAEVGGRVPERVAVAACEARVVVGL